MKIGAKIKWLVNNQALRPQSNRIDTVFVDADYVEADEDSISEYVETVINSVYNEDFVIVNLEDIIQILLRDNTMTKFKCYDIEWDTETEDDIPVPTDLPTELIIKLSKHDMLATEDDEESREELICNKLSDKTGWLVQSYCYEQL